VKASPTNRRSLRSTRRTHWDALTPEELKQQVARLKRAAKRTPLVISAATGKGVPEALRALLGVIDGARAVDEQPEAEPAWQA
jgi:GTP-binding protein